VSLFIAFSKSYKGIINQVSITLFLKSKRLGLRFINPTNIPSSELPEFPKRLFPTSDEIEILEQTTALMEDEYYRESK
jgi:hypothetical protein